jgi:N-acetylmuramoyl-L-alanine amidase
MAKTVCIDSGHYAKYNRCPANPKYYESDMVWKLHLLQKKYLEQLGIKVITTRPDKDKDLSLYNRGAASKGCDLFISDHSNAVGSGMNESVDYVAVYHLTDDKNVKCDDISKEIANKIAPVIAKVMGVKQGYKVLTRLSDYDSNRDGMMNDNYYGVLNGARQVGTAGLIIEHGFHTHSKTVEWLLNDNNLDKLARAEAECIASYLLGKTVTLSKKQATTTTKTLYRVWVGEFKNIDKAKNKLKDVKAKGFDASLVKDGNVYRVQAGAYSSKANANKQLAKMKNAGFTKAFISTKSATTVKVTTTTTAKTIKKGVKVKIKKGAKDVSGKTYASFVYNNTYTVISVSGDRVVFGLNGVATGATSKSNITVI